MRANDPTREEILEELYLKDATFFRRRRPLERFARDRDWKTFSKRYADKPAGCMRQDRYVIIQFEKGKQHLAHRLIWILLQGPIPEGMVVDHINGDPSDNRIENLRLATPLENARNSKRPSDNKSGVKGISQINATTWWASLGGRSLGYFSSLSDAEAAIRAAREEAHGAFTNHG